MNVSVVAVKESTVIASPEIDFVVFQLGVALAVKRFETNHMFS